MDKIDLVIGYGCDSDTACDISLYEYAKQTSTLDNYNVKFSDERLKEIIDNHIN